MPTFGSVSNFRIIPDGRYAVYQADQETDGFIELYSVFSGGGAPVPLNPPLPTGRKVDRFAISPDSSPVLYRANQDNVGVSELFSVPIGGPATAGNKLNGTLTTGGDGGDLPFFKSAQAAAGFCILPTRTPTRYWSSI